MSTAKLFSNGGSQAVRLPKDCRLAGTEVYVKRIGNLVVLAPVEDPWSSWVEALDEFTDDFMDDRDQSSQQERDELP